MDAVLPRHVRASLARRFGLTGANSSLVCICAGVVSLLLFTFVLSLAAPTTRERIVDAGSWVSRKLHLVHDAKHRPAVDDVAIKALITAHGEHASALTYDAASQMLLAALLAEPEEAASLLQRVASPLRAGNFQHGTASSAAGAGGDAAAVHDVEALFVCAAARVWRSAGDDFHVEVLPAVTAAVEQLQARMTTDGLYYVSSDAANGTKVLKIRTLRHVQALAALRASSMLPGYEERSIRAALLLRRLHDLYTPSVHHKGVASGGGDTADTDALGPFHLGAMYFKDDNSASPFTPTRALTIEQPLLLLFLEPGDLPPAVVARVAAATLALETPIGLHTGRRRKAVRTAAQKGKAEEDTWFASPIEQAAVLLGVAKHYVYASSMLNAFEVAHAELLNKQHESDVVPPAEAGAAAPPPRPEFGSMPGSGDARLLGGAADALSTGEDLSAIMVDEGDIAPAAKPSRDGAAAKQVDGTAKQLLWHVAEASLRMAPVLRQLEDESAARHEAYTKARALIQQRLAGGRGTPAAPGDASAVDSADARIVRELEMSTRYAFPESITPVSKEEGALVVDGLAPLITPAWGLVPGTPVQPLVERASATGGWEGSAQLVEGRFLVRAFMLHASGRVTEHSALTFATSNSSAVLRLLNTIKNVPFLRKKGSSPPSDATTASPLDVDRIVDVYLTVHGLSRIRVPTLTSDALLLTADPGSLTSAPAGAMFGRGHAPLAYEHVVVRVPLQLAAATVSKDAQRGRDGKGYTGVAHRGAAQAAAEGARAAMQAVGATLQRAGGMKSASGRQSLTVRGHGHPLSFATVVAARFFRRLLDDAASHAAGHRTSGNAAGAAAPAANRTLASVMSWFTRGSRSSALPSLDSILATLLNPTLADGTGGAATQQASVVSQYQWMPPRVRRAATKQLDALIDASRTRSGVGGGAFSSAVKRAHDAALEEADNAAYAAGVANRDIHGRAVGGFDAAQLAAAPLAPPAPPEEEGGDAPSVPPQWAPAAPGGLPAAPSPELEEDEHARRARERAEQIANGDAPPGRRLLSNEFTVNVQALHARICNVTVPLRPWEAECCGTFMHTARTVAKQHGGRLSPASLPTFTCPGSGTAVSCAFVRDGYCDCLETGADETDSSACVKGVFRCKSGATVVRNGQLVPVERQPDAIADHEHDSARLRSDLLQLAAARADELASHGFIPAAKVADGVPDCVRGEDEAAA